jgi:hypothetical protein
MTILRRIPVCAAALVLAACDNPEAARIDRDACERAGVQGAYAGDVRLGVGEAMELARGASLCLVLPDAGGREYVLAYLDARAVEASRTAREPQLDSFTVAVGDVAGPSASRQRLPGGAAPRWGILPGEGGDFVPTFAAAQTSTDPTQRAAPWAAGEAFTLYDHLRRVDRPARVYRVYDGWLVAAAFTDEPPPTMESTMAMLDQAWPFIRQLGMPLLDEVFAGVTPVTSNASGQLLVVFRPDLQGASGVAYGATDGTDVFSFLAVLPNAANTTRTATSFGSLMFHEITHAFQRSYMHASRPQGQRVSAAAGAARWGIEGGAALMQRELVRRQAGVSPTANYDWKSPEGSEAHRWYTVFAQPGDGSLTTGYSAGAGFLADLIARRMAAGDGVDAAVREVSRGAVEGWFGWAAPQQTVARTGLAARMRGRLGGGWEPEEALFAWTFGHALDDRTGSRQFQDRAFRDVWNVSEGEYGWREHALLAAGDGRRVEVKRQYGSPGYFTLAGGGGAFQLTASVPGVRWMIARAR